ncbi:MAG: SulP family inorganic anion transporter [Bryobacterales bacterium]|nr:SulP family inorganic anion transporter [Bryobacterales bacterium]
MPRLSYLRPDIIAGFLVFLIALPLCLGISFASGYPPTAGLITAILGGMLVSVLGSARLTIKGPAAGLIVVAIGAVTELGGGVTGYRRALAVGVVAGLLQIALALIRAGALGDLMPSSVVHGMLAAIGVIIISKQVHVMLGVAPEGQEPLHLLAEIPRSLANLNPEVFLIGLISLLILFGLPLVRTNWARRVPGPMLVLAAAVPLSLFFDLEHEHVYTFANHLYHVGPSALVRLPGSLASAIVFPDFSMIGSAVSLKYIAMFALVGTIESMLSVIAVDALDPERRSSDLNRDLLATGAGNVVVALVGGLPMISEIVRSKANIDSGARTRWANFFHGAFLLAALAVIPGVLQEIPLAALAAMLVYTGFRLASPKEFVHVYHIGPEQLLLFVTTLLVTLATDLLVGVGVGLVLKIVLHLANGAPFKSIFRSVVSETRDGDTVTMTVHDSAVFTNYLGLKRRLQSVPDDVRTVTLDFENAWVVDHTVLEKLQRLGQNWTGHRLEIRGFDNHEPMSNHELSARRRRREVNA